MITLPSIHRVPLRPTLIVAALLATPFGMTACSSGGSTGTGGSTGGTGGAGTGGGKTTSSSSASSSSTGSGMVCPPAMKYGGGETSMTGTSAKAKIVDEKGAPVAGQPVFICGINICSNPAMTQADGTVSILAPAMLGLLKKPAFKFGDTLAYAELAIPLTMATTDFTTGNMVLATGKLSDKSGAPLTAGADATSGDVTISIPAGASVGVNTLVYDTPDKQKLRTVNIPLTNVGPVLDPVMVGGAKANFALLYGMAPSETTVCPAAKVTVALPATLGWAPGTAVEFWVMTTDTGQTYAPYAGWAKMSDGVVSTDGKSVATVAGQGFIFLENFAVRLKM